MTAPVWTHKSKPKNNVRASVLFAKPLQDSTKMIARKRQLLIQGESDVSTETRTDHGAIQSGCRQA